MKKYLILALVLFFIPLRASAAENDSPDYGTYIDSEIIAICEDVAKQNDIPAELLISIVEHESSGRVDAMNGKHIGLMQINSDYASDGGMFSGKDLLNAYDNVSCGASYLANLIDRYESYELALDIYSGNGKKYFKKGTSSYYTRSVLNRAEELERNKNERNCNQSASRNTFGKL